MINKLIYINLCLFFFILYLDEFYIISFLIKIILNYNLEYQNFHFFLTFLVYRREFLNDLILKVLLKGYFIALIKTGKIYPLVEMDLKAQDEFFNESDRVLEYCLAK